MSDKQLPDGIEWPRFGDGELVQYRDQIMHEGRPETVQAFYFNWPGHVILSLVGVDHEKFHHLFDGEPVKRPPVLDKDGIEIKVGDTVWDTQGTQFVVESIKRHGADRPLCECAYKYEGCAARVHKNPCILTHTQPDSWEKLREDVKRIDESESMCAYVEAEGRECKDCPANEYDDCAIYVTQDIIARAEKLAGVMDDE